MHRARCCAVLDCGLHRVGLCWIAPCAALLPCMMRGRVCELQSAMCCVVVLCWTVLSGAAILHYYVPSGAVTLHYYVLFRAVTLHLNGECLGTVTCQAVVCRCGVPALTHWATSGSACRCTFDC